MKKLQRASLLLSLIEAMKRQGSWCGETSIQKAVYFFQEMVGIPTGFEFLLYKYGPYSFDLTDELTALRADAILTLEVRDPRYGPSFAPGELAALVKERFAKTINRYRDHVEWVADRLGNRNVAELERLSTALYVRLHNAGASTENRAAQLLRLKPHVRPDDAEKAIIEVDQMAEDAEALQAQ